MYLTNKNNLVMNVNGYLSIHQICISIPVMHTAMPTFEQWQIWKISEDFKTRDLRADQISNRNMSHVA